MLSEQSEEMLRAAVGRLRDAPIQRDYDDVETLVRPLVVAFLLGAGVGIHGDKAAKYAGRWSFGILTDIARASPPYGGWVEQELEKRVHEEFFADALNLQRQIYTRTPALLPSVGVHSEIRHCQRVTGDVILVVHGAAWMDFFVGDMKGHGTAAALAGAMAGWIAERILPQNTELRDSIRAIDAEIRRLTTDQNYMAAGTARWYPESRRLVVMNCGSPAPPVLVRGGIPELVSVGCRALGMIVPPTSFDCWDEIVDAGALLVIASDGFVEQTDTAGRSFDNERVVEEVCRLHELPERDIARGLIDAVDAFAAGVPMGDDQSVLVVKLNIA